MLCNERRNQNGIDVINVPDIEDGNINASRELNRVGSDDGN